MFKGGCPGTMPSWSEIDRERWRVEAIKREEKRNIQKKRERSRVSGWAAGSPSVKVIMEPTSSGREGVPKDCLHPVSATTSLQFTVNRVTPYLLLIHWKQAGSRLEYSNLHTQLLLHVVFLTRSALPVAAVCVWKMWGRWQSTYPSFPYLPYLPYAFVKKNRKCRAHRDLPAGLAIYVLLKIIVQVGAMWGGRGLDLGACKVAMGRDISNVGEAHAGPSVGST